MIEKKKTAEQAVDYIQPRSTLAVCGFTLMGACEDILKAIEDRYLEKKEPSHLTLLHAAGHSDRENGIEHLAHEGLVEKIIGSHWGLAPKWGSLISTNKVEAHCLSQGQLTHLFRDMASGKPGTYTKVGLNTFLDPVLEGGRMNAKALEKESLVDRIKIKNEDYLFYNMVPIDVCIIRGTSGDEYGNITMEEEALKLESLAVAQATKRFGGTVIVQVKNYVERGSLKAKNVVIPGTCVDVVVETEDSYLNHRQTSSTAYNPKYTGEARVPTNKMEALPLNMRKVIGRRAACELFPDAIVNLGTGIPGDTIGPVSSEEGVLQDINLTIESGAIGGVPKGGTDFGISENPEAIIEHPSQFDFYNGRGVDITFMGGAEIDGEGNVNVSKFGKVTTGCGGFIDITQNAHKVVYCLTFTASGLRTTVGDGKLTIDQEGSVKKFKGKVSQITFSGHNAVQNQQEVYIVTERAVFQLGENGLVLTEIAPGVELQKDVLDQMECKCEVSKDLKEMDASIFMEEKMGFEETFYKNILINS
ncbi:acyl CoA:acetate/3-ketoacid CoA transferase [Salsuginibacillus kocurii]|uniref:acyl CoA:acetate/3-ketoacid CoA transferase n=1 Tax=Salsuginibacillus kocurii TaxID=427078 RepID=UPI00035D35C7|nr:acyl CoA:acetate/3-ketoacid CoA transferase [Salsuginibacillus kocurii]